ncbi:Uncharacterised protein [Mycobacteroides abscessus subsp. abscessus]|uniref:hypothetical protein n=1 Tax=Mycobacteroides abscessus TaxID=36809 RepID=UPI0009A5BEB9|nr:hypothetical protein [Mycobacteroides abscessus]SLJ22960.1 Uncharacterised protein [Mycobacteroides abscessus subsp. abscessus]
MQYKNLAVLALAAAAALTLTACDPGPSTETDPLAALKSRDAEQQASVKPAVPAPPYQTGADLTLFQAAMRDGVPYIYGIDNGGTAICQTGLVVPTGPTMGTWILDHSGAARIAGQALSRGADGIGECSGAVIPGQVPDSGDGPDAAAMADAARNGAPFIYAEAGGTTACNTVMVLPSGEKWFLNARGPVSTAGAAMSPRQDLYGCGVGYGNPGGN